MDINILFPVYNEQKRVENGVTKTVSYLRNLNSIPFKITIIDNNSSDNTPEICKNLEKKYNEVQYIAIKEQGVGIAFRTGISLNKSSIVGYMDCDLSTDLSHLNQVLSIFKNDKTIDIVNGSRFSKGSITKNRKWYRNITSFGLNFILKLFFKIKSNDTVCGFQFFKKESIEYLIEKTKSAENGWFYLIEILIRAERADMNIYELPVVWTDDPNTTVKMGKVIFNYLKNIYILNSKLKKEGK